ncbi:pentatricopeptide repeat-containing protein At4g14820-like [Ananas comosus]|uniref:Pentatricopeptide repeat-containing protein At4g14820-like n=1 Tax=Ananas comosus TaxID=4615 RepID=A0A6P5FK73_ANACO|nr:pentatricopeptide repeat-containing protein At4g14820-like [Ananas comosus]
MRALRFPSNTISHMPTTLGQIPGNLFRPNELSIEINREVHTREWKNTLRIHLEENSPCLVIDEYNSRRGVLSVDHGVILFVIKACARLQQGLFAAKQAHTHVIKLGFESDLVVKTAFLRVYGLFGDLACARQLFDEIPQRDVVVWNALVSTYSQRSSPGEALGAIRAIMNEDVRPNEVTVTSILSACAQLKALDHGKEVHGYAVRNISKFDTYICNALIEMYAKCRCLPSAQKAFHGMGIRSMVSWTCMINAYCENDCPQGALSLFKKMQVEEVRVDEVTLLAVISMCAKLCTSELAEWIEKCVEKNCLQDNPRIANALIHMHCECGNLEKSCKIFDRMKERTMISWATVIQGLAMHGHGVAALIRFVQMQREGFRPDEILFLAIINACSHSGLVSEGRQCFYSMVEEYGMVPWMEHYGSMVDLLCRVQLLDEAFEFVMAMPVKPDAVIWRMLLVACRDQGNIGLARKVIDYIIELEPDHKGSYILKSNLCAMIGEWGGVQEVRNKLGLIEVSKKDPAQSFIEVSAM